MPQPRAVSIEFIREKFRQGLYYKEGDDAQNEVIFQELLQGHNAFIAIKKFDASWKLGGTFMKGGIFI